MAELATIARPYAEALFDASQGDLDGTARWLDAVATVAADERLQTFADNPKIDEARVYDLIVEIAGVQLPPAGQNFLRVVIDNKRLAVLPEVARQFREMKNARTGTAEAIVYSAYPMGTDQLGGVAQALERRFGRKLQFTVQEDPSLIGGIRVVVGDEVLDTSVRARLEQMKVALTA